MNSQIDRREWDFRARPAKGKDWANGRSYDFLEDDEVLKCWLYECTRRHSYDCELAVERRNQAQNPRNFDSLLSHYYKTDPNGKTGVAPLLDHYYTVWPEWPEQPFLSIGRAKRELRYKEMWGGNPKRVLQMIHLRDIHRFILEVKEGGKSQLPGIPELSKREVDLEPDSIVVKPARHRVHDKLPTEVIAFAIDYNLTDMHLIALFRGWLAKRREEKGFRRRKFVGGSQIKTLRAQLNAIGAQRLLATGDTVEQALAYTEKISGRALYADKSQWSKAKLTAENALDRAN